MNKYIVLLILFTLFFSTMDFYTNIFYEKVWHKKSLKEKSLLIFLLFYHNMLFFIIYFTVIFNIFYYKNVKLKYLIIYFILLIYVPIHWKMNDNLCWYTVQQNKLLEINKKYGFRDPYLILTNKQSKTAGTGGLRDKILVNHILGATIITAIMIIMKIK